MGNISVLGIAQRILAVIGAIAFVAIAVAAVTVFCQAQRVDMKDSASNRDSLFILNWAGVPAEQKFEIAHSFQSARSFTGDHVDGYCILLETAPVDEDWIVPSDLDRSFLEAVTFALDFARTDLACLPDMQDIDKRKILIKPITLRFNSGRPGSGEIILMDSNTKELFFVSFKV